MSAPAVALPSLATADLDRVFQSVGIERWEGLRNARLFLTGGTGFVGKWLLATLQDASARLHLHCQISVLTRNPEEFRAAFPLGAQADGVTLVRGDVRNFEAPAGQFSHVIHAATDVAAAASPLDTFDTCVTGTRRVLDFARVGRAQRLLLVSSGASYGRQPADMAAIPESYTGGPDPLEPGTAYAAGKRASEWLAHAQGAASGMSVTTARCFAFIGPYLPLDKHFAIGNFLKAALLGQPIVLHGDGRPFRSYLHASDMAAWLWVLLLEGRAQRAYNVGAAQAMSLREVAERVAAVVGSSAGISVLGTSLAGTAAERYVPAVDRMLYEFRLPEPLGLDEAILRTAQWHRCAPAPL